MDISGFIAERTLTPEVVPPSPAIPKPGTLIPAPGTALAQFISDPASLKASALSVLDFKVRPVETQEAASQLADRLAQVRTLIKNIEARRKQIVEPLKKEAKAVDEEKHRWCDPLEKWEEDAARALSAFMRLDADRKRREDEARQSAIRDAANKQMQAEAMQNTAAIDAASVEIARIETQAPVVPVTGFKTEAGTISTRKTWKVEVVKAGLLPGEYLMPDMPKLRAAVTGGLREIPGCSIFEDESVTVRTRG